MAKQTTWKCQRCGVSDTHKDDMDFEMVGQKKPMAKRYHKACFVEHLKEKAFKEVEDAKKDELNETLKEIFGVKEMPNSAWTMIQDLRNGEPVFGTRKHLDKITKRYKEGYDYLLIRDTFEYCSDTIEESARKISFDGLMGAFRYAIAIVIDKVYVVEKKQKDDARQEAKIDKHLENMNDSEDEFVSSYKKKKKTNVDITQFLD